LAPSSPVHQCLNFGVTPVAVRFLERHFGRGNRRAAPLPVKTAVRDLIAYAPQNALK
jgi:hypothetical protein